MKQFLISVFAILVTLNIMAVPAVQKPIKIIQPNGDTITVIHKGDEYASWYELEANGQIVDKDASVNEWKYVSVNAGNLVLTETVKKADIMMRSSEPAAIADERRKAIMAILNRQRANTIAYEDSIANTVNMDDSITARYVEEHGLPVQTKALKTPLPTTGNVKILTILVQFSDVKFQDPSGIKQQVNNMINQIGYRVPDIDRVTGSVRDFYRDASYGKLDITSTVVGPYTMEHTQAYYGENKKNGDDRRAGKLVYQAVCAAAKEVDMRQFNNNGDGSVECVHIVYAGHGASEGGNDGKYANCVWPHMSYISPIVRDWVWISRYMITPELYGDSYSGIGTICHEFGHILGAPDFYDTDQDGSGGDFYGTGWWDLMAYGGDNNGGHSPAHPNPYIKTQLFGWAEAQELTGSNTVYTLAPSETNPNSIHKISTPDGGYYLLENRQDKHLDGQGLIIYHIHKDITNKSAGDLLGKHNKVNIGHPQKCYIVSASSDLEIPTGSTSSYGSIFGSAAFPGTPSSPNIFFTSTSTPSNVGWDGQYPQNKDVAFIHEDGDNISFVFNPSISGPSTLCTQGTYSIPDVPDMPWETSIDWSYGSFVMPDPQPVIFGEGQGTESIHGISIPAI